MQLVAITEDALSIAVDGIAADVVKSMRALYARKGYVPPWLGYIAMEDGQCVGTCAFVGPAQNGEVEIAYFTFPDFEGRGVATRMARSLMQLVARESVRPFAHTLPEESSSTSVLRKLGFSFEAEVIHPEDGKVRRWSMPAAQANA